MEIYELEDKELYELFIDCSKKIESYKIYNEEQCYSALALTFRYLSLFYEIIRRNNDIKESRIINVGEIRQFIPKNIYIAVRENQNIRNRIVHGIDEFSVESFKKYHENFKFITEWTNLSYMHLDLPKTLVEISVIKEQTQETQKDEKELLINEIVSKIGSNMDEYFKILKSGQDNLSKKIDSLAKGISKISEDIKESKDLISSIINDEDSSNELLETTISKFQNNIIEKIEETVGEHTNVKKYNQLQDELKVMVGDDNFNKLSTDAINFIVTSKIMYNELANIEGDVDYSGVCLLLTKALEIECHKRFYVGYKRYMHKIYGDDPLNYPIWFVKQTRKGERLLLDNEFTLGTISFALGIIIPREEDEELLLTMNDYCRDELFINSNENYIADTLNDIGTNVDKVRELYRNPAAHREAISQIKAKECFNYLIEVQKLLQKILSNCKY